MKKVYFSLSLAALLVAFYAYAYESYLGVIISSGSSTTNSSTATPFTIPNGQAVAMQCDAAACVAVGLASAGTVTASCSATTGGVALSANQLYDIPMVGYGGNAVDTIAVISSSGTANCRVYKVITP